ncbi:inositol monophosphatase family protein [Larsenimonas rhizosphaerae]|uniref:Inositol monophosphatase n=1 Tax=Larsenimonas rhizosphaerae TaxID=2944682 RepID=A0AA41ZIL9_9GAMM|nr:inositol monophosphatase family protein [Larsenimonas rhizosphaerae]MCM2129907.1 inositol monophosphatase [Larsenimonas rhizosphaerae]MCX2524568.1 inositol monophosphatase [Larsenimonas rhizosphaerae]
MHPMVQFALRALRGASEQLNRVRDRLDIARETQSEDTLLADTARFIEEQIARQFAKGYPLHGISGRYIPWKDGEGEGADYHWKIDLFHGYENLSINATGCAISMVCLFKGRPEHAVIISPFTDDEYITSRGRGAHYNGKRMRVSNAVSTDNARIALGLPEMRVRQRYFPDYMVMTQRLGAQASVIRTLGCPILDIAEVSSGRVDAAIVQGIDEQELAIGQLMLKESGALIGAPNGAPQVEVDGALMASGARLYKQLVRQIQPHLIRT